MDAELRIDLAGAADGAVLLALARAFHAEDGHPLDAAGEAAVLAVAAGEPLARAWILRRGGEALGYLILTLGYSVEYGGRDGFIDDLYLAPALRGQGAGRHLLGFALEQAARLGINTLHLEVEAENPRAHRLYRQAGFEETGRRLMRRRILPRAG
ncbi:GNAT family N-acetyltransferase [Roseomonas sp. M0104]|uniref:GNAT family N-acetyltransferase n=1 Tax=Teichococcus coralli TaxID=2545983 RepID=A0A845BAJ2_9PROT|nr:GNAT family N-acetyltransferase [Pseudoroseomonas coralli]MXP64633.1 GNAT family N-acetyltransferase [Pseudoroseomonas coralli]